MKIQPFQFNMFGELTYLIWDESTHEGAVIDPGMSTPSEQKTIDGFIAARNIKLKYLLYTHLHIDHTLGHDHIKDVYGIESYAGEGDKMLGHRRAEQARMFNLPIAQPKELTIDHYLNDGDNLCLGNEKLEVIFVPGHSQGSVAYYCKEAGVVFTGDALFNGSIGRTDLPGGNHPQLISSIQNRLLTLPPQTIVLAGHGPSTTIGQEIESNPFL